MTREGREIVFIWVPGHVGIRGNSAAYSAAKDALDDDISVELIPFSDLKSRTNKYILELWQSKWDEFPENKLYKIFRVLKECIVCPQTNRKEETVMARLHIGHSFITHFFLLKGEEPPVCIFIIFNHFVFFVVVFLFFVFNFYSYFHYIYKQKTTTTTKNAKYIHLKEKEENPSMPDTYCIERLIHKGVFVI